MGSYIKSTAITKNATGIMVSGPATVRAVGIRSGADAGTVKFYDGLELNGAALRWSLGTIAGVSDGIAFERGLRFTDGVYIVITGTTPDAHIAIDNPQANQLNP